MRCEYCGVAFTEYPPSGICSHCGAKLSPPAGTRCPGCGTYSSGNFCAHCGRSLNGTPTPVQPVYAPVQPVYIPVQPQPVFTPGVSCCPKCHNTRILSTTRGFSWGLGILGFFFVPFFGLLLGLCGRKKPRMKCANCNHKWKR